MPPRREYCNRLAPFPVWYGLVQRPLLHPLAGSRVGSLRKVLSRHGQVSPSRAGPLFGIWASCIFRWPSCVFEAARVSSRVQSVAFEPPPIFIVGHGVVERRCFTSFCARTSNFASPHSLKCLAPTTFSDAPASNLPAPAPAFHAQVSADGRRLVSRRSSARARHGAGRDGCPSFMNCFYFPNDLGRIFAANVLFDDDSEAAGRWRQSFVYFLSKLLVQNPGKRLMLKSPADSARIPAIRGLFPCAKPADKATR